MAEKEDVASVGAFTREQVIAACRRVERGLGQIGSPEGRDVVAQIIDGLYRDQAATLSAWRSAVALKHQVMAGLPEPFVRKDDVEDMTQEEAIIGILLDLPSVINMTLNAESNGREPDPGERPPGATCFGIGRFYTEDRGIITSSERVWISHGPDPVTGGMVPHGEMLWRVVHDGTPETLGLMCEHSSPDLVLMGAAPREGITDPWSEGELMRTEFGPGGAIVLVPGPPMPSYDQVVRSAQIQPIPQTGAPRAIDGMTRLHAQREDGE